MSTKSFGGMVASFGVDVRDKDGKLVVRNVNLAPVAAPTCIKPSCLIKYIYYSLTYAVIALYDARRVYYATHSGRHKVILERYRTGYPMPLTLWQAIHANIKLRCPVCRKYDRDPLLFSSIYKDVRQK
jgi:hypothetical protein